MYFLSVSQVARRLGINPKNISDLLYQRVLRDDLCPIIAGRRLIPQKYLPTIRDTLIGRGLLESGKKLPQIGPEKGPVASSPREVHRPV